MEHEEFEARQAAFQIRLLLSQGLDFILLRLDAFHRHLGGGTLSGIREEEAIRIFEEQAVDAAGSDGAFVGGAEEQPVGGLSGVVGAHPVGVQDHESGWIFAGLVDLAAAFVAPPPSPTDRRPESGGRKSNFLL